jgi:hypothetical protein
LVDGSADGKFRLPKPDIRKIAVIDKKRPIPAGGVVGNYSC